MIIYGARVTYFLCGVVMTLLALYVVLSVTMWVMERKTAKLRRQLEELERQKAELEDA